MHRIADFVSENPYIPNYGNVMITPRQRKKNCLISSDESCQK